MGETLVALIALRENGLITLEEFYGQCVLLVAAE